MKKKVQKKSLSQCYSDEDLISQIITSLEESKVDDIVHKPAGNDYFVNYVVIGTGTSLRHVVGSAEKLVLEIKNNCGIIPVLDKSSKDWVIVMLNSVAVHIMTKNKRDFYKIEDLLKNLVEKK